MVLGTELCLRDAGIGVIESSGWPGGWCKATSMPPVLSLLSCGSLVSFSIGAFYLTSGRLGRSQKGGGVSWCLESSGDACCSQGELSPQRAMRPRFNKNRAFYKENATEQLIP